MTIKAKDILRQARFILSDTANDRWTDERLLVLLNDGIEDIAKHTTLFVENTYYTVQNNVVDIDLSPISNKIVRAEYLDEPLPFYSFEEMDRKDRHWQKKISNKVEAIVYGKQRNGLVKQYPIVENAQNDLITYEGSYGIITGITYSDIAPIVTGTLGDLSDIPDEAIIKFYYVRRHNKVTDINTELEIDELIEQPLKHFIAGMALRDNQDVQNRSLGNEELGIYSTMIEKYSWEKAKGYTRPDYTVQYNAEGV